MKKVLLATIAVLAVGILLAPTLLSRLNIQFPGTSGPELPAYSLGAVSGNSVFVVQRGGLDHQVHDARGCGRRHQGQ